MSEDGYVKWKLKFRADRVAAGQTETIAVQSAHCFRGKSFIFVRPECFAVKKFLVGNLEQLVLLEGPEVPCVVLHGQELVFDAGVIGVSHVIEVRNMSNFAVPFYAELHGSALLGAGEVPRPSDWEDVSML